MEQTFLPDELIEIHLCPKPDGTFRLLKWPSKFCTVCHPKKKPIDMTVQRNELPAIRKQYNIKIL